jgi:hypothetical protein
LSTLRADLEQRVAGRLATAEKSGDNMEGLARCLE